MDDNFKGFPTLQYFLNDLSHSDDIKLFKNAPTDFKSQPHYCQKSARVTAKMQYENCQFFLGVQTFFPVINFFSKSNF